MLYKSSQDNLPLDVPFNVLKADEPYRTARYIRQYIIEPRRGERPLTEWAIDTIKQQDSNVNRRIRSAHQDFKSSIVIEPHGISTYRDPNYVLLRRVDNLIAKNGRQAPQQQQQQKENFGILIP